MHTLALMLLLASSAPAETVETAVQDDAPLSDQGRRFRFGGSLQLGLQTIAQTFAIDAELRFGMQATQWWSAYGLVRMHAGIGSLTCAAVGLAIEAMITNHFAFAVAPVLAYGSFFGLELMDDGRVFRNYFERSGASFKPGFDVRIAVTTGRSRPPLFNRAGMSFALDLLGLVALDSGVTDGRGGITPTEPVWLFSPMLSIGVDFR
ncbi:MAG: hypothetical protein QM817_02240 [Archangium sp.]